VSLAHASCVLPPDELVRGEGAHGLEHLRLAVADVLRSERVGRLHRHEGEHLEQVVLNHVAQRAGLLVVAGPLLDAGRLGDRDLNVVDRLAAPGPLDHRVREPEDQDVLHGLLADVMVDPKHLRLVEDLAHDAAELTGARQVVPDRLLQHDACVVAEALLADPADDRRKGRGWRAAVKEPPSLGAQFGVECHEALAERAEGGRVVERRGDVGEPSRERLPAPLIEPVAGELLDRPAGALAEARVVEATAARAHDRVAFRHKALVGEVVQRREQLAAG